MTVPLLQAHNIFLTFGRRAVLDNVSISVHEKEIVTVIGPNGCGKTSLLRVVCGLQKPTAGHIHKKDNLIIGYMPQKLLVDRVLPLTVRRFLRLHGSGALRDVETVTRTAQEFGIEALLAQQVHDLSGGEMQRVLLARAVLLKPDILVLDEPTQGLDVHGQAEFYRLIAKLRATLGCGVLMVSHDLHMVMAATDRVICINRHVCCEGTPEDINEHPEYVSLFGKKEAKHMAIYTHDHDHTHEIGTCEGGHHG